MMWPAGVEPATPRVSGGRSTGLSYDHVRLAPKSRLGREAADFRDLRDSGSASDPESCDGRNRRGWARTSGLLFVREALSPLSYSPVRCGGASAASGRLQGSCAMSDPLGGSDILRRKLRDKESNLDLHVQSVVSCRLDDPGTRASPSIPRSGRSTQQANAGPSGRGRVLCLVHRKRTMFSVPLANPSTLDRRATAARPALDVLRGGALEPEPRRSTSKRAGKSRCQCERVFSRDAEGLSLSGGASIRSSASSS